MPAKLHQMTDAPIILSYAERLPGGKGFVFALRALRGRAGRHAGTTGAPSTPRWRQLIARCPAQYFWSYNRYKVPAGVAAAPKDEQ